MLFQIEENLHQGMSAADKIWDRNIMTLLLKPRRISVDGIRVENGYGDL